MKIGIVGCGVMGSAMARIIKENHELALYSRSKKKLEGFAKEIGAKRCNSLEELAKQSDAIILAVKPKDLDIVAEDLDPEIEKGTLILSILSGRSLALLTDRFPSGRVFRLMPNLPLLCGKGMIGVADDPDISQEEKKKVNDILQGLGTVVWLEEKMMGPFTALTGSNPAFICLIIEAMIEAGVSMGFKVEEAKDYVLKTMEGTIQLLAQEEKRSPSDIRLQIASPAGVTIAGLIELEKKGVRYGVVRGILETYKKERSLEESSAASPPELA